MIQKENRGIRWLEFELFENCPIVHGCLTKHGGVSTGELFSLNIGRHRSDDPKNVETNIRRIQEALRLPSLTLTKIDHKDKISEVSGPINTPLSDGLMTKTVNLAICASHADCQAAIFYDTMNHKLSVVHAGWRSSVLNIYAKTVSEMKKNYGTKPENLLVGISPSLGPENSEFINYKIELPEAFWQFETKPYHFDFWKISRWQLEEANVLSHHIQIAQIDTKTSPDFFSHRASKLTGRNGTLAMLL